MLWQGFRFALHSHPVQKRNIAIYMIPTNHKINIKMALKKLGFSIYNQSGISAMSMHSTPQTPPDVVISRSRSSHRPSQLLNSDYRELLILLQVFLSSRCHCFYLSSIRIPNVTRRTSMKRDIVKIQSFLMIQEALYIILSLYQGNTKTNCFLSMFQVHSPFRSFTTDPSFTSNSSAP